MHSCTQMRVISRLRKSSIPSVRLLAVELFLKNVTDYWHVAFKTQIF